MQKFIFEHFTFGDETHKTDFFLANKRRQNANGEQIIGYLWLISAGPEHALTFKSALSLENLPERRCMCACSTRCLFLRLFGRQRLVVSCGGGGAAPVSSFGWLFSELRLSTRLAAEQTVVTSLRC